MLNGGLLWVTIKELFEEDERNSSFSYFDGYEFDSCTVFYRSKIHRGI